MIFMVIKKHRVHLLLILFLLLLLFIQTVGAGEKVVDTFNRNKPIYVKMDGKGDVWAAYHDLDGMIHLKNISKDRDIIISDRKGNIAGGLALDVRGDNIFVVWREKVSGIKKLYLRTSNDGGKTFSEPILLDDNTTEALTRVKVASSPGGSLFVLWYGEKIINKVMYHVYAISSNDGGKTFSEIKNLTLGYNHSIYPSLLVDDEGNAYSFSYSAPMSEQQKQKDKDSDSRETLKKSAYSASIGQQKRYMVFRKTVDGGKTWTEPLEIKEIGVVTLFVEPIKVGKRLHVFWYNSYDGVPIVEGAFSDDGGKTWKTTSLEDTKGLDVGVLKVAHDSKGHIYLVMSGKMDEMQKSGVYLLRSEDNGTTWEKLASLRHYPFRHTNAKDPEIAVRDNGEVVAVWVDYRNIRSNLYMQYSKDYGKTWQEKDIPLEEAGRFNTRLYPYASRNVIASSNDRYYLMAYRFEGDGDINRENAKLLLLDFSLDKSERPAAIEAEKKNLLEDVGSPEKIGILKERTADFWSAFIKEDYEKIYSLYDPFFQSMTNKHAFFGTLGRIKYHSFEIKEIKVEGNIAKVKIGVVYSVPKVRIKTQDVSQEETPAEFEETWLYIHDNWYKEYQVPSLEQGLVYY